MDEWIYEKNETYKNQYVQVLEILKIQCTLFFISYIYLFICVL